VDSYSRFKLLISLLLCRLILHAKKLPLTKSQLLYIASELGRTRTPYQWLKSPSMVLNFLSLLPNWFILEGKLSIPGFLFILFLSYLHQKLLIEHWKWNPVRVQYHPLSWSHLEPHSEAVEQFLAMLRFEHKSKVEKLSEVLKWGWDRIFI